MTNNEIILGASLRLMAEGKLRGTGRYMNVRRDDGTTEAIEIPEPIHTFNGWKAAGYSVKKGEKSSIRIVIWKHTARMLDTNTGNAETDAMNAEINREGGETRMFMKNAAFFTFAQVEPIKARA